MAEHPSLLIVGHGSRSAAGVAEYWDLARVVADQGPELDVGCGFIELAEPDLDAAVDRLVERGAASVVAVPLVLLGAGHMKDDGPAALHRGRHRHPAVRCAYARHLGIHPSVLTDRGLQAAIETLAGRAPVPVEIDADLDGRLPMSVETTAYFVVAEALTNVGKYAHSSRASVAVRVVGQQLEIEVLDDGVGGADPQAGSGLRGLADRVAALQGALNVTRPPGRGTRIHARISLS